MRLTYIIDSLNSGGKERQLSYLLKELSGHNDIQLIVFSEEIFYKEVFDLPIIINTFSKNKKYNPKTILQTYNLLKSHKTELVHSWSNIATMIAFPYFILHPKVKLISSIRYAGKLKKTIKGTGIKYLTWARSIAIVSNSKRGLDIEKLQSSTKGITIYNGIDIKQFDKNLNQRNIISGKIEEFAYKVVMLASFSPAKDYKTFIEAAKTISKQNKNACFLCVGDGASREQAEKESGKFLNKTIFFLGNRKDIPAILKSSTIGVLLNNTNGHAEGISNAIMEYMSAGLPVVATNAGGTPELVKNGESGFLVPAFDEKTIIEKIEFLLKNPNVNIKMGKRGREIIIQKFSIQKMTDNFLELYRKIGQ